MSATSNPSIRFRRPSQKRLEEWLDHQPERFERYLAAHPEIGELFEADNPLAKLSGGLREALDEALDDAVSVPVDLAARLREQLFDPARGTSPLAVGLDLFGVGIATMRYALPE